MNNLAHPSDVLYAGSRPFPRLAACEHFAGSEKMLHKALQIQAELSVNNQPVFDITADARDTAKAVTLGAAGRQVRGSGPGRGAR
jgi:citrate lyase subunit beta/citryl-CoA lyase